MDTQAFVALMLVFLMSIPSRVDGEQETPLCEWQGDGAMVNDPCPEFYWEKEGQSAYRLIVSSSRSAAERQSGDMWDSGTVETPLSIAEYEGEPLRDGQTYWWRLKIWDAAGKETEFTSPRSFKVDVQPLPKHLPHIRTFLNFGSKYELIAKRYDLTFRSRAKEFNPRILAINYSLLATMVIPSEKASMLEEFCAEKGLTRNGIDEDMFLHFREDKEVTLHVGAERASNPRETRRIPGWDPVNDRNGDGYVDDQELARLANPRARARRKSEARVPIYFWGPPRDDFVMNVGNKRYQQFLAEAYVKPRLEGGFDGLFIDTTPSSPPGVAGGAELLEYPRKTPLEQGAWMRDMQIMLARVKIALGHKLLLANGWNARPFVIDGMERENWLNICRTDSQVEARLASAADLQRRGKMQLIQYNPIYHPEENEFGRPAPVSEERDRIYGLALYYLIAGDRTYFGIGQHPYRKSEEKFFPAIEVDIGKPKGDYSILVEQKAEPVGRNLLENGGFEEDADGDGKPDGWMIQEPVALTSRSPRAGKSCACIESKSDKNNNINKQYVTLEPNTYYTLSAWVKVENVSQPGAAQVYPYEFNDADYGKSAMLISTGGTHDWRFFSSVFKTGKDAHGRINFRIFLSAGRAWFDDISLVKGAFFGVKVLAREFDRARVLVRPPCGASYNDTTGHTLKLPGKMRPLRMNGTLAEACDTMTLCNGEGAILIKCE